MRSKANPKPVVSFVEPSKIGDRKSKTCTEPRRSIQNLKSLGLCILTFVLVAGVTAVRAQQPPKILTIGYLAGASRSAIAFRLEAFRQGLRELGYVEGKNITIRYRY